MVVPDFEVLGDKVSVRYKGAVMPTTYAEGSATCKDGEVFNEHIGKAIAISKALDEELPKILQGDIPQPDEKVDGMYVHASGEIRLIDSDASIFNLGEPPHYACHKGSLNAERGEIVDDTNAEYEIQGVRV